MDIPDQIFVRFWPNGATSVYTEPRDEAVAYVLSEKRLEKEDREADDRE